MEMRRKATSIPWHERLVLTMYWLLSGYGLRASRAFLVLIALVALAALALSRYGFCPPGHLYTAAVQPLPDTIIYAAGSALSLDMKIGGLPEKLTLWGQGLRIALRITGPMFGPWGTRHPRPPKKIDESLARERFIEAQ
ncbi:hypothetical protein OG589_32800 [Sphaerisporangium sp. NBC_01403]|uniref:hypothetical protein n=1 Tax=Sphaerisporangium sp. NBC_01403 TaxID=2903599 RepID=UPI0032442E5B